MEILYWRKDSFEGIKKVIELAKANPEWKLYTKYCETKESGLRKQALKILEDFIAKMNSHSIKKRIEFVNWIEERRMRNHEVIDLVPNPLQKKLIEPTLEEWKELEPNNPIPYRWINSKESLIKATELDKDEQIARYRLFHKIIGWVDYNQHELEDYLYIEDPKEDLELLEMVKEKIEGISIFNPDEIFDEIEARISICKEYIEFEKSGEFGGGKFIAFMKRRKPNFNFGKYL